MIAREGSSSGDAWPSRSRRAAAPIFALLVIAAAASIPASIAQSQEEPPEIPSGVPEHYPGLRIYAEGEIIEVLSGGLALRLLAPTAGGYLFGDGRSDPRDPLTSTGRSFGIENRDELVVNLTRAQGWLFIDDPDGGPQTRVRLDQGGRELFAPGQMVEIGPAPGLKSSASEGSIGSQSTSQPGMGSSTRVILSRSVKGWIYVRVNRFKEQREK